MSFAETSLNDSVSQRRAKIVATLGPASNTVPVFRDLVRAGVDVVRLNFSHGTHEEKLALIQMIRRISREERKPLCILGDLQGPKIRTSKLKDHQPVILKAGARLTITAREVPGTASCVGTTFKTLAENVEQGSRILLSDGLIELPGRDLAVGLDRLLGVAQTLQTRGFAGGAARVVEAVARKTNDDRALVLVWRSRPQN